MKNIKLSLLILLICMVSTNLFAQKTTLEVDNQTPGWLSSKIGYGDQQAIKNLKVTGYLNGTDINFLIRLQNDYALRSLDLSDASIVKGGENVLISKYNNDMGYDRTNELTISEDNYLYGSLFLPFINLKKISIPKSFNNAANGVRINADTVIVNGHFKKICICTGHAGSLQTKIPSVYNKVIELAEGIDSVALNYRYNNYTLWEYKKIILPSTITKIADLNIEGGNIISKVEHPEDIVFYNFTKIKGDTIYVPQGTTDNYKKTKFSGMKYIVEMNKPNSIDISQSTLKMYKNDVFTLSFSFVPKAVFYKDIKWESSNESIAIVNQNGEVTALSPGTVEITVSSVPNPEAKAKCSVSVYEHTTDVDISKVTEEINIGESFHLLAKTLPLGTSDNQITWSSSNEEIANVDNNGKVTGLSLGSCIITATAKDGGSKAECVVTVVQPAKELSLNKHTAIIKVGNSEELRATVSPETTTDKSVNWASMDNSIAEVNNNGVITGKKAGKVTIVAQATTNPEAKDYCEVTVLQPVTGIEIDKKSITFTSTGESCQLSATVKPDDASDKTVRWFSSNTAVCTVSKSGVVIATGAGNAIVTATSVDGGFVAVCIVTVNESSGILDIEIDKLTGNEQIYDAQGKKQNSIKKGLNIIRMGDGTTRKVVVK